MTYVWLALEQACDARFGSGVNDDVDAKFRAHMASLCA
jgi:hypothetical protein